MSKFKIKMKLTGFELEIEGSRDDVPMIAQNLGQQIAGMISPAASIVEGNFIEGQTGTTAVFAETLVAGNTAKPSRKRKRSIKSSSDSQNPSEALEWRHDSLKYGEPAQSWKTAEKAIWMIHVVKCELQKDQLSATAIADTFNKKFRQSGTIRATNVSRDLGKMKVRNGGPPSVGLDTQKSPNEWFLTTEGTKAVQELINTSLTPAG
jgi:hypothetical protein